MKLAIFLFILSSIGAAAIGFVSRRTPSVVSSVGTNPGDVKLDVDPLTTARARGHEVAMFAAGCFWGVESDFRKESGVVATAVGYSGGSTDNPTYEAIHYSKSGHREAVLVEFDPLKTTFQKLLTVFWNHGAHRPKPRVQYESAIFYFSGGQQAAAERGLTEFRETSKHPVSVEILPAGKFWLAEDYHQQYFGDTQPTCSSK